MAKKSRILYILHYLWDRTDEENRVTISELRKELEDQGFHANRKTIAMDLKELQENGFDIICVRSRQNQYFLGTRGLELAELKLIVDAVQAAKFISLSKSISLIAKVAELASPAQRRSLNRRLYIQGKPKTSNEQVLYTIDLLHTAIADEKSIDFQYIEYTVSKEKVLKHHGKMYHFSPYDLVWDQDRYYVLGWSESHQKISKFRVDRMVRPSISSQPFHLKPDDYNVEKFCGQVFQMYDGLNEEVHLLCSGDIMKNIVDRFGEDVRTTPMPDGRVRVTATISVSPTFIAWVFTYGEKIRIESPEWVRKAYLKQLEAAYNRQKDE